MSSIFKCPDCGKPFMSSRSMKCHQGGAHRKGCVERNGIAFCKHCGTVLSEDGPDQNWPEWAQKQHNHICSACKAKMLKDSDNKKRQKKIIAKTRSGTMIRATSTKVTGIH